jgi:hypothetical protein
MEVSHKNAVTALVDAGDNEVSDRQIDALCQGGGAYDETYIPRLHSEFDREPQAVRDAGMMGENAEICRFR